MVLTSFHPILASLPVLDKSLVSNTELINSTEILRLNYPTSVSIIFDAWQTGVWKGLFLALPFSVTHLLVWRTTFFDSWRLGIAGVVGKCAGELLLIFSIILGWRGLFHLLYLLAPFLLFFSVSYIMFVTTFGKFNTSPGAGLRSRFVFREEYGVGFLAHLFLGLTQQTYICHRLSNIALDWDDKIPFGSLFKTPDGYIDQTIGGTTLAFCLGLIGGYLLITFLWFYFGTFVVCSFFTKIEEIQASFRVYADVVVSTESTFQVIRRSASIRITNWFTHRGRSILDYLLQSFIFGLTWFHITHYPSYYVSAEGLQLVSQYFDREVFKIEQTQEIPREVNPKILKSIKEIYPRKVVPIRFEKVDGMKIDPIDLAFEDTDDKGNEITKLDKDGKKQTKFITKFLRHSITDRDYVTDTPMVSSLITPEMRQLKEDFDEYEKEIKKQGGFILGDRIYSRQLLTRFGPFMPIQKYGNSWGWGEYTEDFAYKEREKSTKTKLDWTIKQIEFFDYCRWFIRHLPSRFEAFMCWIYDVTMRVWMIGDFPIALRSIYYKSVRKFEIFANSFDGRDNTSSEDSPSMLWLGNFPSKLKFAKIADTPYDYKKIWNSDEVFDVDADEIEKDEKSALFRYGFKLKRRVLDKEDKDWRSLFDYLTFLRWVRRHPNLLFDFKRRFLFEKAALKQEGLNRSLVQLPDSKIEKTAMGRVIGEPKKDHNFFRAPFNNVPPLTQKFPPFRPSLNFTDNFLPEDPAEAYSRGLALIRRDGAEGFDRYAYNSYVRKLYYDANFRNFEARKLSPWGFRPILSYWKGARYSSLVKPSTNMFNSGKLWNAHLVNSLKQDFQYETVVDKHERLVRKENRLKKSKKLKSDNIPPLFKLFKEIKELQKVEKVRIIKQKEEEIDEAVKKILQRASKKSAPEKTAEEKAEERRKRKERRTSIVLEFIKKSDQLTEEGKKELIKKARRERVKDLNIKPRRRGHPKDEFARMEALYENEYSNLKESGIEEPRLYKDVFGKSDKSKTEKILERLPKKEREKLQKKLELMEIRKGVKRLEDLKHNTLLNHWRESFIEQNLRSLKTFPAQTQKSYLMSRKKRKLYSYLKARTNSRYPIISNRLKAIITGLLSQPKTHLKEVSQSRHQGANRNKTPVLVPPFDNLDEKTGLNSSKIQENIIQKNEFKDNDLDDSNSDTPKLRDNLIEKDNYNDIEYGLDDDEFEDDFYEDLDEEDIDNVFEFDDDEFDDENLDDEDDEDEDSDLDDEDDDSEDEDDDEDLDDEDNDLNEDDEDDEDSDDDEDDEDEDSDDDDEDLNNDEDGNDNDVEDLDDEDEDNDEFEDDDEDDNGNDSDENEDDDENLDDDDDEEDQQDAQINELEDYDSDYEDDDDYEYDTDDEDDDYDDDDYEYDENFSLLKWFNSRPLYGDDTGLSNFDVSKYDLDNFKLASRAHMEGQDTDKPEKKDKDKDKDKDNPEPNNVGLVIRKPYIGREHILDMRGLQYKDRWWWAPEADLIEGGREQVNPRFPTFFRQVENRFNFIHKQPLFLNTVFDQTEVVDNIGFQFFNEYFSYKPLQNIVFKDLVRRRNNRITKVTEDFLRLNEDDKTPLQHHIPEDPDELSTPEERLYQIESSVLPFQYYKILGNTLPYDHSLKKLIDVKRTALDELEAKEKYTGRSKGRIKSRKKPKASNQSTFGKVSKAGEQLSGNLSFSEFKEFHMNQLRASNKRVRNVVDFMFRSKADQFEHYRYLASKYYAKYGGVSSSGFGLGRAVVAFSRFVSENPFVKMFKESNRKFRLNIITSPFKALDNFFDSISSKALKYKIFKEKRVVLPKTAGAFRDVFNRTNDTPHITPGKNIDKTRFIFEGSPNIPFFIYKNDLKHSSFDSLQSFNSKFKEVMVSSTLSDLKPNDDWSIWRAGSFVTLWQGLRQVLNFDSRSSEIYPIESADKKESLEVKTLKFPSVAKKRSFNPLTISDLFFISQYLPGFPGNIDPSFSYLRFRIGERILQNLSGHLKTTPKTFENKNNEKSDPVLVNTSIKKQIKMPKQTFFTRTVKRVTPNDQAWLNHKEKISKIIKKLNSTDFETEFKFHDYHRSPQYRNLVNHNVSKMLAHDLPSRIMQRSSTSLDTEMVRQKMFVYYQTQNYRKKSSFQNIVIHKNPHNENELDRGSFSGFLLNENEKGIQKQNQSIILHRLLYDLGITDSDEAGHYTNGNNFNTATVNDREPDKLFDFTDITFFNHVNSEFKNLEPISEKFSHRIHLKIPSSFMQKTDFSSSILKARKYIQNLNWYQKSQTFHNYTYDLKLKNQILSYAVQRTNFVQPFNESSITELDQDLQIKKPNIVKPNLDVQEAKSSLNKPQITFLSRSDLPNAQNKPSFLNSKVQGNNNKKGRGGMKGSRKDNIEGNSEYSIKDGSKDISGGTARISNKDNNNKDVNKISKVLSFKTSLSKFYRIPFTIYYSKSVKKRAVKRLLVDTLPFRLNLVDFKAKRIGIKKHLKTSPLRDLDLENFGTSSFLTINTHWKPFIFSGLNFRELPLQSVSISGGILPRLNTLPNQAVSTPNLWNLTGKLFEGEKSLQKRPGPYSLGILSFDPKFNSQILEDFTTESGSSLLSFFEDFWAAKLRIGTYDSWLNVLPSESNDPLYNQARNTVHRLRNSQARRLERLAVSRRAGLLQKLKMYEDKLIYAQKTNKWVLNPFKKQREIRKLVTDFSKNYRVYEFLNSYLRSYGIRTIDEELKLSNNLIEVENDPSPLLLETGISFLHKDNRYKPWYHEELSLPTRFDFSMFDPDTSLTNTFLSNQNLFSSDIFSDTDEVLLEDDNYLSIDQQVLD